MFDVIIMTFVGLEHIISLYELWKRDFKKTPSNFSAKGLEGDGVKKRLP